MKLVNKQTKQLRESAKDRVKACYRDFTGLNETDAIEKDKLEPWAVDKTAVHTHRDVEEVREWLTEDTDVDDTTIDSHNKALANEVNAEAELDDTDSKGVIENTLDRLLKTNLKHQKRGSRHFNNVIFEGAAGTGKTSRIIAWANANNVNLVIKSAATMDESDFAVMALGGDEDKVARKLRTNEFDILDQPRSVLFLDEFNRARSTVRGTLLTLINDHFIPDPQVPTGKKEFPNFLFTIIAVNPFDPNYNTEPLDAAEESRFETRYVPNEKRVAYNYYKKKFEKDIELDIEEGDKEEELADRGRLALMDKLLKSPEFNFDDSKEEKEVMQHGNRKPLNLRSFENVLEVSDGTKDDLINIWSSHCNNKKLNIVKSILKDYVDIKDKANSVFDNNKDKAKPNKAKSAFAANDLFSKIYGNE